MEYFKSEYITENIIRICDITNTAMYLVVGKEKACLLDTGIGLGNVKEYVKTLVNKPVFVILTHGHFDHVGAAALFEEVYLNPKDFKVYKEHSSITYKQKVLDSFPGFNDIPKEAFNPVREEPFLPLMDEQVFDLGDISVKAIAVPGHTQGMMKILIPEEEIILFGDACGVSVLLFEDYASTVSEYKKALEHVKENYTGYYKRIIRNHGTFESSLCILDNVIACCDDILNKKDDHIETEIFGQKGFFIAKAKDENGDRVDGQEGNIVYRYDKAI